MLLNGILNFGVTMQLDRINVANSDWALRHTDLKRNPKPEMFRRIYDRNVGEDIRCAESCPPWWSIDVSQQQKSARRSRAR